MLKCWNCGKESGNPEARTQYRLCRQCSENSRAGRIEKATRKKRLTATGKRRIYLDTQLSKERMKRNGIAKNYFSNSIKWSRVQWTTKAYWPTGK